jgi:DNA-binding SARP family transcriptional activator
MRTYVMRLRRCLGPVGVRIISNLPGWTIALDGPSELDLIYAEQLWRVASAASREEDWEQASSLLTEALAQWRGEPLIDVPSTAIQQHPTREQFRVQVMLARDRSGQQAAALDAYRDAHRALANDLGIPPGPGLRDMHQRVLANDPGLNRIADQNACRGQVSGGPLSVKLVWDMRRMNPFEAAQGEIGSPRQ